MFEYAGAIHIHSHCSDGSGSLKTIVKAARRAGAHFIVISDHNNMKIKRERRSAWSDDVLVIVGEEISPRYNHYLALGIQDEIPPNQESAQANIDAVASQGGVGFISHPFATHKAQPTCKRLDKLLGLDVTVYPWDDLDVEGFDGIEVWQYMYDWVKHVNTFNAVTHAIAPGRFITGPDHRALAMWDAVNLKRKVVGIGTLDAHAKPRVLGMFKACSYRYLFSTIRTHILLPKELTGDAEEDEAEVIASLRYGSCFIANDSLADASGFGFQIRSGGFRYQMGDECPLYNAELFVVLPRDGEIRILCNGLLIFSREGGSLCMPISHAGNYRIEARLNGRPWIYSNMIYVV